MKKFLALINVLTALAILGVMLWGVAFEPPFPDDSSPEIGIIGGVEGPTAVWKADTSWYAFLGVTLFCCLLFANTYALLKLHKASEVLNDD